MSSDLNLNVYLFRNFALSGRRGAGNSFAGVPWPTGARQLSQASGAASQQHPCQSLVIECVDEQRTWVSRKLSSAAGESTQIRGEGAERGDSIHQEEFMSSHAPQLKKSKRGIALPVLLFYSRCEAFGLEHQTNEVGLSFGGEGVRPHSIVRGSKFGGYARDRIQRSGRGSAR